MASFNKRQLTENGFCLLQGIQKDWISECRNIIDEVIGFDTTKHCAYSREDWHKLVRTAQDYINLNGALDKFIAMVGEDVKNALNATNLGFVNVLKLRAVRPLNRTAIADHVPFHRETFYAKDSHVRMQFNLWTPISVVDGDLAGLMLYPESHKISDTELSISQCPSHESAVRRFSDGHAIGYPYSPKIIQNLAEITSCPPLRVVVPYQSTLLFSSMLIHGNGVNRSNATRFSVDTGAIDLAFVKCNDPLFAAGNKGHYRAV